MKGVKEKFIEYLLTSSTLMSLEFLNLLIK